MSVALIYYSHQPDGMPAALTDAVLDGLNRVASEHNADPVAVTPAPIRGWRHIAHPVGERGSVDQDQRILAGLFATTAEFSALVEHDVLYPSTYLDLTPWPEVAAGGWWYDCNTARANAHGFIPHGGPLTSCLIAKTLALRLHFADRLERRYNGVRIVWDEPGLDTNQPDRVHRYRGTNPVVDVRWGGNMTGNRFADRYVSELPYWGEHRELWQRTVGQ